MRWRISNGKTELFWKDTWLGSEPLKGGLGYLLDDVEGNSKVLQFWDQNGGWKWEDFAHCLPASRLVNVASVVLRLNSSEPDKFM